jgi:hypothetical protein
MAHRETLAVLGLALLLALAGCSGFGGPTAKSGNGNGPTAQYAGGNGNGAGDGSTSDAADDGAVLDSSAAETTVRQRQLIRTGEIRLRVNDTDGTSEAVRSLAAERDGFVSGSNVESHERHNGTLRTARIVIRVPSEEFDATVAEIESMGTVRTARTSTEDVTDQLVDIEARLENLRAERDRLRELYQQANETEDVLAVQRELADVQKEIERLEARRASLERDVAYSTITVHITEEPPDPPEPEPDPAWYETGLVAAFLSSVDGVVTTIRALAVAGAYLAPYALVFGPPLVGGAVAVRRFRA